MCVKREWKYYFPEILVTGPVWPKSVGRSVDSGRGEEGSPTTIGAPTSHGVSALGTGLGGTHP